MHNLSDGMCLALHPGVGTYLDSVVKRLPADMREEHRAELACHLHEIINAQMAVGQSEAEAVRFAISRFGDASQLGRDLSCECRLLAGHGSDCIEQALYNTLFVAAPLATQAFMTVATHAMHICPRENAQLASIHAWFVNMQAAGESYVVPALLTFLPLVLGIVLGARFDYRRIILGWLLGLSLLTTSTLALQFSVGGNTNDLAWQFVSPILGIALSFGIRYRLEQKRLTSTALKSVSS